MDYETDKEGKVRKVGCGCGCLPILLNIIAFILICSIFGCEWARNAVKSTVHAIAQTVRETE